MCLVLFYRYVAGLTLEWIKIVKPRKFNQCGIPTHTARDRSNALINSGRAPSVTRVFYH